MPVGLLTLEIHIPDARSLKDKRQVLRSLKERLRARFNVRGGIYTSIVAERRAQQWHASDSVTLP